MEMKKYRWNAKKCFTNIGKLLLIALVIALLMGFIYECSCYKMVCTVKAINDNVITIQDCNGYEYDFYGVDTPYKNGDNVIVKFHNPIDYKKAESPMHIFQIQV